MTTLTVEHIRSYLARHPVSGISEPLRIEPVSAGAEEQRFRLSSACFHRTASPCRLTTDTVSRLVAGRL